MGPAAGRAPGTQGGASGAPARITQAVPGGRRCRARGGSGAGGIRVGAPCHRCKEIRKPVQGRRLRRLEADSRGGAERAGGKTVRPRNETRRAGHHHHQPAQGVLARARLHQGGPGGLLRQRGGLGFFPTSRTDRCTCTAGRMAFAGNPSTRSSFPRTS